MSSFVAVAARPWKANAFGLNEPPRLRRDDLGAARRKGSLAPLESLGRARNRHPYINARKFRHVCGCPTGAHRKTGIDELKTRATDIMFVDLQPQHLVALAMRSPTRAVCQSRIKTILTNYLHKV
jgi:hypothetical protein